MKNTHRAPGDVDTGRPSLLPLSLIAAISLLLTTPFARATPAFDPICGQPNTLEKVQVLRAKMAAELKARRSGFHALATASAPQLSLTPPVAGGLPHLIIGGTSGQSCDLESTTDLASTNWSTWLSVSLGDQPLDWTENLLTDGPSRFFRARATDPESLGDSVSDLRLLDAQGVSHGLYYNSNLKAIVVVSAGADLGGIAPLIPTLNQLATHYANTMQFWVLLSDPAPVRTNIISQAVSLKLSVPVLLDANGLGALAVGLTHVGEVAVVQPPIFTLGYRGEVIASSQTPDTSYLAVALAGIDGATPFTFTRTPMGSPKLATVSDTVPSYSREVAPILYKYCAICHRPGDVAPFAMTNYDIIQAWAADMQHMVMAGKMPPWHVDPDYGHWNNDLSIPGPAKATLVRWLAAGAPRGDGNDPLAELPIQPSFNEWPPELGEPDALVSVPLQPIKESGSEPYRYIFIQTPNTTNVWLRAAVIRPTNYRAVHHYQVWLGQVGNGGTDGFSTYQTSIAGYVPGFKPFQYPTNTGVLLTKQNWLTFNLHYTPYGQATNDQPVLALWYHKTPPAKQYQSVELANPFFAIPPGVSDYPATINWTATKASRVYRLNPHMHLRGKRMNFQITYPTGKTETVLSVPDYDFNWQVGYEFSPPLDLPAGAKLLISGAWDNSALNLSNPDPTATVFWGDQSWSEMFVGFIDISQ